MNSANMAAEYLKRAKKCLIEAKNSLDDEDYPISVRRSQEAVEFAVKAVLRLLGFEYPRKHDVSDFLDRLREVGGLPDWFLGELQFIKLVMSRLSSLRGLATYGDEKSLVPPSKLFGREDAETAYAEAGKVVELCESLYSWWFNPK